MTQRKHMILATILAIAGSFLIRLSLPEMQPWDEALYAVRGKSVVVFSSWFDQTPYALGGLYSATPPPIVPWMIAASISLLGPSDTAVRLPIVLCSVLSLFLIARIGRRVLTHQGTLLAILCLGTSMPWVVFSRSAMTEVPLMMWCLLALEFACQMYERKGALYPMAGFAAAFGAALLTKMAVSFLPLLFILPVVADRLSKPKDLALVVLSVIGGFAIAFPWYYQMVQAYGDQFWLSLTVPHIVSAVEGNAGSHGVLYYLNRILAAHPIFSVPLVFTIWAVLQRQVLPARKDVVAWILLLWFSIGMVVLSLAATKHFHYTVFLLPPAAVLSAWILEHARKLPSARLLVVLFATILASCVWSAFPTLRAALASGSPDALAVGLVSLIVGIIVVAVLLPMPATKHIAVRGWKIVISVACVVGAVSSAIVLIQGRPESVLGGREIALRLIDTDVRNFGFLYHQKNSGDAFAPQLAWYMGGRMAGWMPGYGYVPVALPGNATSNAVDALTYGRRFAYIVYHHPGASTSVVANVSETLGIMYDLALQNDHYMLFRRR